MKAGLITRSFLLTSLVLALPLGSLAYQDQQSAQTVAPARPWTSPHTNPIPKSDEMAMPLTAPLFVDGDGVTSVLTVVNETQRDVKATLAVYDLTGAALANSAITVPRHSQLPIDIHGVLASSGAPLTRLGSLQLIPDSAAVHSMALAAQLTMRLSAGDHQITLEEELLSADMRSSNEFRAATLGPPVLAVTNMSSAVQSVDVSCSTNTGPGTASTTIALGPRQTSLLSGCSALTDPEAFVLGSSKHFSDRGPAGLIVKGNGPAGSLAVFGFETNSTASKASALTFFDPALLHSATLVFPGVLSGRTPLLPGSDYSPAVAVANMGPTEATVSITSYTSSATQSRNHVIAHAVLPPGSARKIPITLAADEPLQNTLIVTSTANAGDVVADVVSEARDYGSAQVIGKDSLQGQNGGGHPWDISTGNESTLILFNTEDTAKPFDVFIAAGSTSWHKRYTLSAGETHAIKIGSIVSEQIADDKGKVLPASVTLGEVSWFTPDARHSFGRVLITNSSQHSARNFSCGYYIVLCGSSLDSYYAEMQYLTGGELGPFNAQYCTAWNPNSCYGDSYNSNNGINASWNITDPSIVAFASDNSSGSLVGQYPGATTAQASYQSNYCQQTQQGSAKVTITGKLNIGSNPAPANLPLNSGTAALTASVSLGIAPPGFTDGIDVSWGYNSPIVPSGMIINPSGQPTSSTTIAANSNTETITYNIAPDQANKVAGIVMVYGSANASDRSNSNVTVNITGQMSNIICVGQYFNPATGMCKDTP